MRLGFSAAPGPFAGRLVRLVPLLAALACSLALLLDRHRARRSAQAAGDARQLPAAERLRQIWLANLAHDLRTPLASLQALLDALDEGAIDEPELARDFLRRMQTEVQGLSRLVNELLELARLEQGQIVFQPTLADPLELLTSVAQRMRAQAESKQVQISVTAAGELPQLYLDLSRMEQVLLNLIQNALDASAAGGRITLRAAVDAASLLISVEDTGSGIAPEELPYIFERFYRVAPGHNQAHSGLGLAIARQLVERHGGQISASSQPGVGTTLSIRLPLPAAGTGCQAPC